MTSRCKHSHWTLESVSVVCRRRICGGNNCSGNDGVDIDDGLKEDLVLKALDTVGNVVMSLDH